MFDFYLQVPAGLKSPVRLIGGKAEGSFGYELKVKLTSDLVGYSSVLPLLGPRQVPTEIEGNMYSQGFARRVSINSFFKRKEAGSTQVYCKILQSALVDSRPLDVVLDLDNSHSPVAIKSAYLSLVRIATFKAEGRTYEHVETVKTAELDDLPVEPGAFSKQHEIRIYPWNWLSPTFNGDLISNKYFLRLDLDTKLFLTSATPIYLSEIMVLSSEIDQTTTCVAELKRESTAKWLFQCMKRLIGLI
jgi:hypothetical protein